MAAAAIRKSKIVPNVLNGTLGLEGLKKSVIFLHDRYQEYRIQYTEYRIQHNSAIANIYLMLYPL